MFLRLRGSLCVRSIQLPEFFFMCSLHQCIPSPKPWSPFLRGFGSSIHASHHEPGICRKKIGGGGRGRKGGKGNEKSTLRVPEQIRRHATFLIATLLPCVIPHLLDFFLSKRFKFYGALPSQVVPCFSWGALGGGKSGRCAG